MTACLKDSLKPGLWLRQMFTLEERMDAATTMGTASEVRINALESSARETRQELQSALEISHQALSTLGTEVRDI